MTDNIKAYWTDIKGKRVFFLGAGISHRDLIPKYASMGADVTLCDARSAEQLADYLAVLGDIPLRTICGEGYLAQLGEADIIFRTPGIDYTKPEIAAAVAAGKTVTSEMEMFFRFCPSKIIGITGSDGKTTTTTLIARVLEEAGYRVHLGGNLGRPLFPMVEEVEPDDIAVVELSSFQLISMRQSPDIAVVTNITPNHLDHHKDMREYVDAKRNILLYQDASGVAVLNAENGVTAAMRADVQGEFREFGRHPVARGAYIENNSLFSVREGIVGHVMSFDNIALRGEHNKDNIATAYCTVMSLVDDGVFSSVATAFSGVEHRIELVREKDGVSWYNDSIATSPTRTIAGLRAFDQKILLIAGGSDKGLDYAPIAPEIDRHVRRLYLSGPTADKIERALDDFGSGVEIVRTGDVADSVARANTDARPGDVVMLSPASPSFDSYSNFEERGKHFKALVNAL